MKGFIIYALGHPNYYRMAETLAASLIYNCPEKINIALICDDPKKACHKSLFTSFVPLPSTAYKAGEKLVFNKATIGMYGHSPFDVTIKLDADMIWLEGRNPMALFDELSDLEITLMNRGSGWGTGNSVWADENDIRKAYRLNEEHKLFKIYGEFLYFKKGSVAKKFFSTVNAVFNRPKVKCAPFANGTFTDELAYQIACMITGIYPHRENYTPVYNTFLGYKEGVNKYAYQLAKDFYAYSIGGNFTQPWNKNQYNILAQHYFKQIGLQNPYQVKDKRSFLPERVKL